MSCRVNGRRMGCFSSDVGLRLDGQCLYRAGSAGISGCILQQGDEVVRDGKTVPRKLNELRPPAACVHKHHLEARHAVAMREAGNVTKAWYGHVRTRGHRCNKQEAFNRSNFINVATERICKGSRPAHQGAVAKCRAESSIRGKGLVMAVRGRPRNHHCLEWQPTGRG